MEALSLRGQVGTADDKAPVAFRDVYACELEEIRIRREKQFYTDADKIETEAWVPENLTGLALSGGGIRSATFCLGLLQGLHKLKLLRIFDYISTVSGGGYVGGWWSAWLSREQTDLRLKGESPFLTRTDIKNPVSLILKIRHSKDDEVAKSLRVQYRADGRYGTNDLISAYDESEAPSEALLTALVKELNRWIASAPHKGAPGLDCAPSLESECKARPLTFTNAPARHWKVRAWKSRHDAWRNRLLLESHYPYEFLDIFPQRERIEPRRARPTDGEPEGASSAWVDPIHHLRLFASYLTPRRGALSADTWRAVSVISRNLVLTWLILLPLLITVLLPGHIFLRSVYFLTAGPATAPAAQQVAEADALHKEDAGQPSAREGLREGLREGPQSKLGYIALVASFFVSMIVLMTILWLLTIRDTSASNSLAVTMVCLGVVAAVICAGVFAFSEPEQIPGLFKSLSVKVCLGLWLAVAVAFLTWTYWPLVWRGSRRKGQAGYRWARELRRNRISRIHTKLMVWLTLTTVALLLVAYGPDIVKVTIEGRGEGAGKGINWLGFLPLVSAVAGSIFTAVKARPSGGGEKRPSHDQSVVTRLILAITPGLVMLVLAVGAAWLGDLLIRTILGPDGGYATRLTSAAIYYGGVLCFALAVYEMDYPPDLKPTWPLIAFVCLLTVTISLIIGTMITLYGTAYKKPGLGWQSLWAVGLVVWPSLVAAVLLVHSLLRVFGRAGGKSWLHGGRLGMLICLILFAGLTAWLTWPLGQSVGRTISPAPLIPLVCVATLAGSLILFRMSVVRRAGRNQRLFDVKALEHAAWAQQPWALWLLASICLMLPVLTFNVLHEIVGQSFHASTGESGVRRILVELLYVLALGALPLMLWLYCAATAEFKRRDAGNDGQGGALRLLVDVSSEFGVLPETIPGTLAAAAVLVAIVVGFFAHLWAKGYALVPLGMGSSALLAALIAGGALSLVLLKSSVPRMPVEKYGRLTLPRRLNFIERGGAALLWILSTLCILVAFFVGFLSWNWVRHIEEYIESGLVTAATVTTLAGMAGCFTLTFFEIFWGRGQNRRTLWLLGIMYLLLLGIFSVSLIPDSEETLKLYVYTRFLLDMGGMMATVMVWLVALGWMVDPNGVSMHNFYKSRLVRAYLGASNQRRLDQGREITEAAAGDDVPLCTLRNCQRGAPYHLINATLNLVAGRDLATAQRSATSFVLSSHYCGSTRTAYRPTAEYMSGEMSLGTAVATSGAAVSPNMGAKKPTAALAMLMTLLNVRLGFWSPTPNRENWKSAQPRLWPFYLIREFLSQTNDLSSYCYLTDGGHFDNTGLYPLVERGCRFIVLVDCGADPRPCFSDLGDAIRRCRIDFGTEIKLDIKPLLISNDKGPTKYFVVGGIRYSREHAEFLNWDLTGEENSRHDKDARTGIIVYLKPSILNPPELGKETADVRQYAIENSFFPQETTANQWFDEAQFESYRRLGQLIAKAAFEKIKVSSPGIEKEAEAQMTLDEVSRLSSEHIRKFFTAVKESFDKLSPSDPV